MKKTYINPAMRIVLIQTQLMQTASLSLVDSPGTEPTSASTLSRRGSFFDDEDEY